MKNKLLTIGEFSKRTGCSIKSLRYYDLIGLLNPVFVDSNTNYRYYTFEQVRVAELIQMCVYLSIPLKEVKELVIKDKNKIDYTDLINYGRKITKEKINELNDNLIFLDTLQQEIDRIDSYDNDKSMEFNFDEKYYYTMPLYEDEMNDNYYKILDNLFKDGMNKNLLFKNDYGVIINIKNNVTTKFVALEVDKKHSNMNNVIKISKKKFLCKKTNEFNFNKIYDIFSDINSKDKTIIITNVYSCDFSNPYFEAKCTLKP